MDEELSTGGACRWCRLLGSQGRTVYDDPAFVIVETPTGRKGRSLTLVPRAHVNVVTELPLPQMAAVLAGLSRASGLLRHSSGGAGVRIHAHARSAGPLSGGQQRGHLHFQLSTVQLGALPSRDAFLAADRDDASADDYVVDRSRPAGGLVRAPAEGPSVFASLADAISH